MYGQMTAEAGSTSVRKESCKAPSRRSRPRRRSTSGATWPASWWSRVAWGVWAEPSRLRHLNGGAFLGIEVDAERIKRRIRSGYCDICVNSLDEAIRILKNAVRQKQAVSVDWWVTAPTSSRSWRGAASSLICSLTRPLRTIR